MIKKIAFSLLFLLTISTYSQQKTLNNYKYIIVPDKFEFLKKSDQYQTSSLLKFLLEKKGFVVYLSNDEALPKELVVNRCLALNADIIDYSSMFTVKSKIQLKDCYNTVIYTSAEGKSKEKDYKKSYHEAIRKAYASMEDIDYNYSANEKITKKVVKKKPEVVLPVEEVVSSTKIIKDEGASINLETLYAQEKPTGYQLVNTTPTIIFQVLKTNLKDVFIIKGKNGILYKSENRWVAEYYENDRLVLKNYTIKF